MKKVSLIPYVCGAGGSTAGSEQGPSDLRRAGLESWLRAAGIDAAWQEDPDALSALPQGKAAHARLSSRGSAERRELVLWHARHIRDAVEDTLRQGKFPVTLGGDHSMAAGSVAGLARQMKAHGRIGLLWIDAHADINTPQTTTSHAWHGMPVAALLGMGDPGFTELGGAGPVLKPEHVCYFGLRDVDPPEAEILKRQSIDFFTMERLRREGIEKSILGTAAALAEKVDYLVLSLDVDAFDPEEAPATGTPVAGGFRRGELLPVLEKLVAAHDFALIELAEYNPALPGADKTRDLVRESLTALLRPVKAGAKSAAR
jgi:arginase